MQAVSVNTAGGVTGGDHFALSATAHPETRLTLTTQAAERAYKSKAGETGRIDNNLSIAAGAHVNWLPQETILFDGCNLDRRLRVDIAEHGSALIAETVLFGRGAMGEIVSSGRFRDRIELWRAGKLHYLDQIDLCGDIEAQLARPGVANGARALTTLLFFGAQAEAHLDPIRELLPDSGGASMLHDDLLVVRMLATDGFVLRQSLLPILRRALGADLPRPWMI